MFNRFRHNRHVQPSGRLVDDPAVSYRFERKISQAPPVEWREIYRTLFRAIGEESFDLVRQRLEGNKEFCIGDLDCECRCRQTERVDREDPIAIKVWALMKPRKFRGLVISSWHIHCKVLRRSDGVVGYLYTIRCIHKIRDAAPGLFEDEYKRTFIMVAADDAENQASTASGESGSVTSPSDMGRSSVEYDSNDTGSNARSGEVNISY